MKHIKRKSSKIVRKAQSIFLQGILYPALEDARQAFSSLERVPYMPEIEDCTADCMDFEIADAIYEGR